MVLIFLVFPEHGLQTDLRLELRAVHFRFFVSVIPAILR